MQVIRPMLVGEHVQMHANKNSTSMLPAVGIKIYAVMVFQGS